MASMSSDVTLNIQANLDSLDKAIKRINKSMKFDLGVNIKNALDESTKGLKEGFAKNIPTAEIDQLKKKIREAVKVKLRLDFEEVTKNFMNFASQITGIYIAFKGVISKPIGASIDFNNSINEINRFANVGKDELEKLKKDMWDLGKNNGVSMPEILKTTELGTQLGVAKNEIKDFSQLALNLQVGLKLGVEESVQSISKISKAFGMHTKDLEVFSDTLTQMGLSTKTSAKAILEVTKSILLGAKAFGLSATETSALSSAFLSVGLDSAEASSSINKFFTELNNIDNATPAFTQALSKMGLDAQTLKEDIQSNPQEAIKNLFADLNDLDDTERFGVISELFGKKMANNINSAKEGVKAFNVALESSKDSIGALQKAVDRVAGDGFGDLVVSLGSAFKHLMVSIGNGFVPMLSKLFGWAKSSIEWLSDFLDNHKWVGQIFASVTELLFSLKILGVVTVGIGAMFRSIIFPFQIAGNMLVTLNLFLKLNAKISNLACIASNRLFYAYKYLRINIGLMTRSILRFNYRLAIKNTLLKISTALTYTYTKALFVLNRAFKLVCLGVSLFSKIFRVSMWSIKGVLISTGIGALIVGLGFAMEYVYTNWDKILPKLIGLWEWIKEKFAGIMDWFGGAFDWLGNAIDKVFSSISGITDLLGITDSKSFELNAHQRIIQKGIIDETLAKQNENKAKMLSSIQSSQTDNSRQINDYKTITINTVANAKEIASYVNSYSYADDEDL